MLTFTTGTPSRWELAAQAIAVRIRWFGLVVGYLLVNLTPGGQVPLVLNAILTLGAGFTLLDTVYSLRRRIFLGNAPLLISGMEALFIALLCYFDRGLDSGFRYYYFLSLICCALRYSPLFTYLTCALHCLSYGTLAFVVPQRADDAVPFTLTLVVLIWVTWASTALGVLLKQVGDHLGELNAALRQTQLELEQRIAERTQELQEAQAHLLHQEKMAAFGLLAAGIAHEVGNPLTSISSLVQILQRRDNDSYTQNKLDLVGGQLLRIQSTLRELIEFSRPASNERTTCALADILTEALSIAKYYKRTGGRLVMPELPPDLPPLSGVRDQLVQVFLNLILNAIDAVGAEGGIILEVGREGERVTVCIRDTGPGIAAEQQARVFQPYFTTKRHGTGLGLFVTRKLVLEHGGSIVFESAPGQGTTFLVQLPLAPRRLAALEKTP